VAGLFVVGAARKRLEKELGKVQGAIKGKEAKLANQKFVGSAPTEIVERERTGLAQLQEQSKTITEALGRLPVN
jgi:valyl-tRNA synthetase